MSGDHSNAIKDVLVERAQQDSKWGVQDHHPMMWIAIISEEIGECAKEALNLHPYDPDVTNLRQELIQVAAVATAAVECLDRNTLVDETP